MNATAKAKTPGLSPGEKTKLLVFLAVLFVVGNLLLADSFLKMRNGLLLRRTQLRASRAEAEAWLAEKEDWAKRSAWLDAKQPVPDADRQADVVLLESLQKNASENHITIAEQSLKEARTTAFSREVSVQLRVSGTLESFCRWLAAIQQPSLFQSVSELSLKGGDEKEPDKVAATLVVSRLYAPGTAAATARKESPKP